MRCGSRSTDELGARAHGDAAAGQALMARAIDSRHADGADSALVVDADGKVLAREHPAEREVRPS